MNDVPSSPRRGSWIIPVVGLVVLGLFWLEEKRIRDIRAEKDAAAPATEPVRAAPAVVAPAPAQTITAASAETNSGPVEIPVPAEPVASTPAQVMTPTGMAPAPAAKGLVLAGTHATPIAGGLRASMRFNPTTTEPIGLVTVVVRVPKAGDARILDIEPLGNMVYGDVAKRVSEDGKFAIYQGTPQSVSALEFGLSVSGDTVADVRGTAGIGPFDLTINGSGATARPKP